MLGSSGENPAAEKRASIDQVKLLVDVYLKSPATANYQLEASGNEVTGFVDAKNSFGVPLREPIQATLENKRVISLTLGSKKLL